MIPIDGRGANYVGRRGVNLVGVLGECGQVVGVLSVPGCKLTGKTKKDDNLLPNLRSGFLLGSSKTMVEYSMWRRSTGWLAVVNHSPPIAITEHSDASIRPCKGKGCYCKFVDCFGDGKPAEAKMSRPDESLENWMSNTSLSWAISWVWKV